MKNLLKEPLLHFALIGAVLFLIYGLVDQGQTSEDAILIDDSDVNEIISKFELQWNRPPSLDELSGLLGEMIRQEVFYQEALRLNLDHNDEIIKRRLAQKMQFLSNDLAEMIEPTEEELNNHLQANSDKFQTPAYYSFYQVYFSNDLHPDAASRAEEILAEAAGKDPEWMRRQGDPIALKFHYEGITDFNLRRQLGTEFMLAMREVQTGSWTGPVRSGYGFHLILMEEVTPPETPPLDEVRNDVLADLNYVRQGELKRSILKELLDEYELVFDFQAKDLEGVESKVREQLEK